MNMQLVEQEKREPARQNICFSILMEFIWIQLLPFLNRERLRDSFIQEVEQEQT